MHRAGHAARMLGIAAEPLHLGLKVMRHLPALARIFLEQRLGLRIGQPLSRRAEALFTVLQRLDERIQRRHRFAVVHSGTPFSSRQSVREELSKPGARDEGEWLRSIATARLNVVPVSLLRRSNLPRRRLS